MAQPPRPPDTESLEELEAWRRDVMEPWMARMRARAAGKAVAPRPNPSLDEQRRAATIHEAEESFVARVAANRGRPLSERVPERSLDDIRARHGGYNPR